MIEELLVNGTGDGCKFWMDFIGNAIPKYTDENRATDSASWVRDLSDEVFRRIPSRFDLKVVDENIVHARLVGLILVLWASRITRAKAYDARRPVEDRVRMMGRNLDLHHALLECVADESRDHEYFPEQNFDPPHPPFWSGP